MTKIANAFCNFDEDNRLDSFMPLNVPTSPAATKISVTIQSNEPLPTCPKKPAALFMAMTTSEVPTATWTGQSQQHDQGRHHQKTTTDAQDPGQQSHTCTAHNDKPAAVWPYRMSLLLWRGEIAASFQ